MFRPKKEIVTGLPWAFESSKPDPSDTLPLRRPNPLLKTTTPIPFKYCHSIMTKCSNNDAIRPIVIKTTSHREK